MRSGGARRGKANGGFGAGGHLGLGSFGKHHVSTRPPGNSVQALNGAEQFVYTMCFFICATFRWPTAIDYIDWFAVFFSSCIDTVVSANFNN